MVQAEANNETDFTANGGPDLRTMTKKWMTLEYLTLLSV